MPVLVLVYLFLHFGELIDEGGYGWSHGSGVHAGCGSRRGFCVGEEGGRERGGGGRGGEVSSIIQSRCYEGYMRAHTHTHIHTHTHTHTHAHTPCFPNIGVLGSEEETEVGLRGGVACWVWSKGERREESGLLH